MMAKVLIVGATGYVGRRLVPKLLERGHEVSALARTPQKMVSPDFSQVKLFQGDVLDYESLTDAFKGQDVVYYLVHSMSSGGEEFEDLDRKAAENASRASKEGGVKRIVYLGGLGKNVDEDKSTHLRSRHEVGNILRESGIPVTEFRAAVLIGTASFSFEMIHHLVNRLPAMICPRWVTIRTQPIATDDALRYLSECLDVPESAGRIIDIGGPDVLTYYDMMKTVADVLRLRRWIIMVPVLTPRLSSWWIRFVTPVPVELARSIIDSLKSETVCENDDALKMFDFEPIGFETAVRRALMGTRGVVIRTEGESIFSERHPAIDPSHLKVDQRREISDMPVEQLFERVQRIGGTTGYYYADWLWRLRGMIDRVLGGIGMRKGRRDPYDLKVGDQVDFWRVEEFVPGKKLLLHAEMNIWGQGWLEFLVEKTGPKKSRLTQTIRYYPRGLWGHIYWTITYPIHLLIFKNMARGVVG